MRKITLEVEDRVAERWEALPPERATASVVEAVEAAWREMCVARADEIGSRLTAWQTERGVTDAQIEAAIREIEDED